MKRLFHFSRLICAIAPVVCAAAVPGQATPTTATPPPALPRIAFSEITFDFGSIKSTDTLKHDFIFTNTGQAVLEITDVQTDCGCTTAAAWDRQVPPGRTGRIPIAFSPANFSGPVSKSVTVFCNDPAHRTNYLQISATVQRPIEVQPQYIQFVRVEGEETNETKVARIISHVEEAVTLEVPRSVNPAFQAELKTVRPGKEFELHVTCAGPATNAVLHGNILINNSASASPVTVTAYALTRPALAALPPRIPLPAAPPGADQSVALMVYNHTSRPVQLSEPTVNAPGVTVQMQEQEAGKTFKLDLRFPAQFQTRADERLELSVKTTHPRYPVFTVPITQATVPPPAPGAK